MYIGESKFLDLNSIHVTHLRSKILTADKLKLNQITKKMCIKHSKFKDSKQIQVTHHQKLLFENYRTKGTMLKLSDCTEMYTGIIKSRSIQVTNHTFHQFN